MNYDIKTEDGKVYKNVCKSVIDHYNETKLRSDPIIIEMKEVRKWNTSI